jgi:N-acetylneuraminate synthase
MAEKLKLGNRYVGDSEPVYLIAEVGINHNGDLQIAKKLIDAAWAAGWDCVKFQKRTPDICVPENQKSILRQTPWGEMSYIDYKKKVEFNKEEYDYINKYCGEKPLAWTASAWDLPSLRFIVDYDIPFIKIPSAKLTDHVLLRESAGTGKPLIVSTGMSTLAEVDEAVGILEKYNTNNYILMHVNSTYPAKLEELNMKLITVIKERYNCLVGYSGHEYEMMPSVVASVYGACVVERHITLDHAMWGTDQAASLEIKGMDILARRISDVRKIAGDGIKTITEGEMKIREKLRG